ncbi:MAG TPA: helix-turn-helix domain-containing protein, partial [Novosphingobium sp.]|nr:helix-turn-helix domain-containing protein [Novosphingobium sp.]
MPQTDDIAAAHHEAPADQPPARRRRRSREDVVQRIHDAARQLFAEKGFAAATTKEIARLADVSETLLFRYYGDKAGLFGEVVTQPFQQLMDAFVARHPDPTAQGGRLDDTRLFTRQVYGLFEANEGLFRALLAGPGLDEERPHLGGLAPFFAQAVDQVGRRYAA